MGTGFAAPFGNQAMEDIIAVFDRVSRYDICDEQETT